MRCSCSARSGAGTGSGSDAVRPPPAAARAAANARPSSARARCSSCLTATRGRAELRRAPPRRAQSSSAGRSAASGRARHRRQGSSTEGHSVCVQRTTRTLSPPLDDSPEPRRANASCQETRQPKTCATKHPLARCVSRRALRPAEVSSWAGELQGVECKAVSASRNIRYPCWLRRAALRRHDDVYGQLANSPSSRTPTT